MKLKYLCRIVGGGTPDKENLDFWSGDIPWVSAKDMGPFRISSAEDHITPEAVAASATRIIPAGSVLLVARSGILRHTLPVGVSLRDFAINQDLKALIPGRRLTASFLAYFIKGNEQRLLSEWRKAGTTVESIEQELMQNALIPLPSIDKQTAITEFLDERTSRIDDLVAKKRRLIDLLDEKHQALISHAVTQGLDPAVRIKDSGVEWLGDVPAHWVVAPLSSRFEVKLGKMLDARQITGQFLVPYLRNTDVRWDSFEVSDLPRMDFDAEDKKRFGLRPGDLIVCEGGEVGRAAVWQGEVGECCYQKALHRLRPRGSDVPRFMLYVLRAAAAIGTFRAGSNQNTFDHLTAEKLRAHRFAFPSPEEQHNIADCLDRAGGVKGPATGALTATIDRLREYRAALITAAVTGQLDIRAHEKKVGGPA
jgi:type I restriction enzyme S subunit